MRASIRRPEMSVAADTSEPAAVTSGPWDIVVNFSHKTPRYSSQRSHDPAGHRGRNVTVVPAFASARRLAAHCAAMLLVVMFLAIGESRGDETSSTLRAREDRSAAHRYSGTMSCSSVTCHGETHARDSNRSIGGNEWVLWLQSDPHARSAETIWSERFHQILARMGSTQGDQWDRATYDRCARCHDPQAVASADSRSLGRPLLATRESIQPQGIGCESCHGPASDWLALHYRQGVTADQLAACGMPLLRDLGVRGQVCATCHVGSTEQDMYHDMIAAGHPALRFELSSYHDQLPKHWPAARERRSLPDFHARLWAAGQLAAANASLQLLQGRIRRANEPSDTRLEDAASPAPWPELAEYRCLACHQHLSAPEDVRSVRLSRLARRGTGLPEWNPWHSFFLQHSTPASGELPAPRSTGWLALAETMHRFPAPQRDVLEPQIQSARSELDRSSWRLAPGTNSAGVSAAELASMICQTAPHATVWEECCQLFLATQAAIRCAEDRADAIAETDSRLREVRDQYRNLSRRWREDLQVLRLSLAFAESTDWPKAMLRPGSDPAVTAEILSLEEIRGRIVQLAQHMQRQFAEWDEAVAIPPRNEFNSSKHAPMSGNPEHEVAIPSFGCPPERE